MDKLSRKTGAADSVRLPDLPNVTLTLANGRVTLMGTDRTIGSARRVLAQAIHHDMTDFANTNVWGTNPEELARLWAELLVEESGGSYRLFEALGEHLRACAAEGQEWASGALAAMEGRAAA